MINSVIGRESKKGIWTFLNTDFKKYFINFYVKERTRRDSRRDPKENYRRKVFIQKFFK